MFVVVDADDVCGDDGGDLNVLHGERYGSVYELPVATAAYRVNGALQDDLFISSSAERVKGDGGFRVYAVA